MAINSTTLVAAITASSTQFSITSATGVANPVYNANPNFGVGNTNTILLVDQEFMFVTALNGTTVNVTRGIYGTQAAAHLIGAAIQVGLYADFPSLQESFASVNTQIQQQGAVIQIATFLQGTADALTGVSGYYLVKTGSADAITLTTPTAAQEGNWIEVWSDTAFAHTITAASACIAAGQALKTIITFPAFRGAGCALVARNLTWQLVNNSGVVAAGSTTLS
jgi:hypothetical protein